MGRKGIGKLSVFSIADRVHVYTVSSTTSMSGLEISVNALREAIMSNVSYHPSEVVVPDEYQRQGTTILLTDLKSKRADLTVSALRKRLARRFDVLDQKEPDNGGFAIIVNGTRITYEDRQELKNLDFIWEFGRRTLDGKYSVRAWEGTLEARPWWVLVAGCALWFGVRGYGGVPGFVILGGSWSGSPVVSVVQGRSCWRAWPSGGLPPAVAQAWR